MSELATLTTLTTVAASGSVVTVKIPASAAYDFDKMTRVTKTILDKLGCGGCHSGHDIRFLVERNFIVDEQLNVRSAGI